MQIAAMQPFVDSASYNPLCQTLDRDEPNLHHFANPHSAAPDGSPRLKTKMNLEPKDMRRDVEAVLSLYLAIEYFPIRSFSGSGQPPIHESRLHMVVASEIAAEMDRVTHRPQIRPVFGAPPFDRWPLKCVAPRESVVEVIKSGGHTPSARVPTDSEMRLWKSTIATKLHRIGAEREERLLAATEAGMQLSAMKRVVRQLSTTLGSPSQRKKFRNRRREFEGRRDLAVYLVDHWREQRLELGRSRLFRESVEMFYRVSTVTPEMKAYIFREGRD